jgi:hypothetical protein
MNKPSSVDYRIGLKVEKDVYMKFKVSAAKLQKPINHIINDFMKKINAGMITEGK